MAVVSNTTQRRYTPGDQIIAAPAPAPVPDVGNETEFKDMYDDPENPVNVDSPNPVLGTLAHFGKFTDQFQRNVGSGIMQIPTDIGGLVDAVRIGAPAILKAIPPDDTNHNYVQRLSDSFMDGIFSPEAKASLQSDMLDKVNQLKQQIPNATPEQVSQVLNQYQNSGEFFDKMTSLMPLGFKLSQWGNNFANQAVGLGKRPDQQTIVDDLEQMFGQSIVGLPESVTKAMRKKLIDVMGNHVMDSVAAKVALKAAELISPGTIPHTPANVAANVAVGGALTEAQRKLAGTPDLFSGTSPDLVDDTQPAQGPARAAYEAQAAPIVPVEPGDGHGTNINGQIDQGLIMSGATLGALFAFPQLRRAAAQGAQSAAQAAVSALEEPAGRTMAEQAGAMKPILSPITGMANINAPIVKGANKFISATDDETLPLLDAQLSGASTSNRVQAENNAYYNGILANHPNTLPFAHYEDAVVHADQPTQDLLNKYLYAVDRQQSMKIRTQSLTDEKAQRLIEAQAAQARGDTKAANVAMKKYADAQQSLTDLQNDTFESRPAFENWSQQDVNNIISVGKQNPKVMQLVAMHKKIGNDITTYIQKNGVIDSEEALYRKSTRPIYTPRVTRAYEDVGNSIKRNALLFRDKIMSKPKDEPFYLSNIARDETGENVKVNNPKNATLALKQAYMDAVRGVTANNARKTIIKRLKMLPGAEGTMFRQFEFKVGNGTAKEISQAQFNRIGRPQVEGKNLVRVLDNGKLSFYQFSDDSMTNAMQFAPIASVPILNATRKAWQVGTTGIAAPWFAAKNLLWDTPVAAMTSQDGRSLGLVDTYARRAFNESPFINGMMDNIPDPSAFVSPMLAIPYASALRSSRAIGMKIAHDLSTQSGMFNALAQSPGGKQLLAQVGANMVKTYDRSVLAIMSKNLSTSLGHLSESARIVNDYKLRGKGTSLGRTFAGVVNSYRAAIENVHASTRIAFFYANYSRLEAKYGKLGKSVPQGEIDKLIHETRLLTGDLSRTSGSKFIQGLSSVLPYANAAIQGSRHVLTSAIPPIVAKGVNAATGGKANMIENRTSKFWPQMMFGMMIPAAGAAAAISSWPEADGWWQNKVPEWQHSTGIPFPTYDALEERFTTGQWPQFSPDKMHVLPVAPELMAFVLPFLSGLRSLGIIGKASNLPAPFGRDVKAAFDQVTGLATPPIIQAAAATTGNQVTLGEGVQPIDNTPFGGANADMTNYRSDVSKPLYDIIGALASSAGQLVAQTWDVGQQAMKDGKNVADAADRAFDTFKGGITTKLPAAPLFGGKVQQYAFTPESEYVFNTEQSLQPIIGDSRQMSVETDKTDKVAMLEAQGLTPPQKISDPMLKQISTVIYDTLMKKGPFKAAGSEYSDARVSLAALEASRARWPEEAYQAKRLSLVQQQQRLKEIQAQVLQSLQQDLTTTYGQVFQQYIGEPFSFDALSNAVRKDVMK